MFALAGLIVIVLGGVMLAFPDFIRSWDRFKNDLDGVETKQGQLYEANRMIGGVVLIIMGIFLIFVVNTL